MDDISVLVCDDSALMRNVISRVIDSTPGMKVVEKAMNGQFLINKLEFTKPDVIILDIEMPVMNGIEFLRYRKTHGPDIPVIILSSIAEKGASVTMEALELGASDFITKPNGSVSVDINSVAERLIEMIASYGGAQARINGKNVYSADFYIRLNSERAIERKLHEALGDKAKDVSASLQKPAVLPKVMERPSSQEQKKVVAITPLHAPGKIKIIAIGISTGGPNALREVFANIDPDVRQPILIVQHMPAGFTKEFAASLDRICPLSVKEAEDRDILEEGHVYIAPGDYHIVVESAGLGKYQIRTNQLPQRNGHRPSADVMFESVGKVFGNNALGVIMTGMGKDGAVELAEMRKQGAWTLGQDEKSAIVYGMPRVAWELGAVQKQVSLEQMANEISTLAKANR
ncbi:chemotaxis response regulator protein-glutamate methylesterase [uncultured Treponema sp.]|uniref:protein-glutamate methylesterase/protein-glutamine glutaminase n=1 Tax=uncultured Treponema sp. TaxID=162155 RepID=UPI0015C0A97C|nr:chemotaxis response regulator protein-glutamate methylesterase [uncultured Treponema sp.]